MEINHMRGGAFQSFYVNRQEYEEKLKSSASTNTTLEKDTFERRSRHRAKAKKMIATAAILGGILPVVASNVMKGRFQVATEAVKDPLLKAKDKFKAVYNMFEIENFGEILASTTGAIMGGVASGVLLDKNPENREEKYREGIFEFLNNMTPTTLVAAGEYYSRKTGKFTSAPARAALIAGSVASGMFIANKTSNKINEKIFDKDKKEEKHNKRNFKPQDCLVHMDDILGLLVLAKIPLAKVIQADKILPFLYAKSGYEAGVMQKDKPENKKCDKI